MSDKQTVEAIIDMERRKERAAVVTYLRDAIGQGYPANRPRNAKCSHGTYNFEDCIGCYDEFLISKLEAIERGEHTSPKVSP